MNTDTTHFVLIERPEVDDDDDDNDEVDVVLEDDEEGD